MANEYIRKQDAIASLPQQISIQNPHMKGYVKGYNGCKFDAERAIKNIEPADVVPVVRCGQCGYWHDNDGDYGYCYAKDGQGFGHAWRKNDFCSYGERK